jgi:hypothetical protein
MAADWAALANFLRGKSDTVTISWRELEDVVGGMPRSSLDHPAWWGGDRPHTRAWKSAGFVLAAKRPGVSVTFNRVAASQELPVPPAVEPSQIEEVRAMTPAAGRLLLIACGKAKASRPTAAKDLYVSPRFRKARAYVERSGAAWFILSAEHGLVGPDEWLAPYERYLPTTPRDYRTAWGEWVAARLALVAGPLDGRTVEVHAGEDYVQPLTAPLTRRGARIERPLEGLTATRWQGWYDAQAADQHPAPEQSGATEQRWGEAFVGDAQAWISRLGDQANSVDPADLATLERAAMDGPGLYSWFVDQAGAADLGRGLGVDVPSGLIYVGQTGATKWPSGKPSQGTLLNRIKRQHLGGRRSSSTLRRTLGAIVDHANGGALSKDDLTAWMFAHLRVVPAITADGASLGDLERQVVQALQPPLNLDHVGPTPARIRLKQLRADADDTVP